MTSDNDNESIKAVYPNAALQAACQTIHTLLEQFSQKDSPPCNDAVFSGEGSFQSPTISSSSDDSCSNDDCEQFLNDYNYRHSRTTTIFGTESPHVSAAYHRMGHAPMVHLCRWTLEKIQGVSPVFEPVQQNEPILVITPQQQQKAPSKQQHNRSMNCKQQRRPFFPRISEEKKEETDAPTVRLQMFASEYARHLSHTQLAPPLTTQSRKFISNTTHCKPPRNKKSLPNSKNIPRRETNNNDPARLTGAVLDILILTDARHVPPPGYSCVPGWNKICVKKEANWDKAAQRPTVAAITLVYPDAGEFVPPGFCVAKSVDGAAANVAGSSNQPICYLVFRRSREGNPITGLVPLVPPESVPAVSYSC
jgi:hypothetical protein